MNIYTCRHTYIRTDIHAEQPSIDCILQRPSKHSPVVRVLTDPELTITEQPGYANRRINLTFLYGSRDKLNPAPAVS